MPSDALQTPSEGVCSTPPIPPSRPNRGRGRLGRPPRLRREARKRAFAAPFATPLPRLTALSPESPPP